VAFGVAGASLTTLAFAAAAVVGGARASLVDRLRGGGPTVKRGGGYVLLAVGAWFVGTALAADAFARVLPGVSRPNPAWAS
jgi:hypothetical protein